MYTVTVSDAALPPAAQLEQQWRELESRSDASFFLSWSWIGTWLSTLPSRIRPRLVRATVNSGPQAGLLVGMAWIVDRTIRRRGIFFVRKRVLHATGNPQLDALMIEYNGVLTDRAHPHAQDAVLRFLAQPTRAWEELHLPALARAPQPPDLGCAGATAQRRTAPTFQVHLHAVRERNGDYLALLHRDTRYQIRRGQRELETQGAVTLTAAADATEALAYLDALSALHQTAWTARGQAGAFANPATMRFHRELIARQFAHGALQLLRLQVGDQPVGYLYNFVHAGHVYNYQSGIDYSPRWSKSHPGLIAHTLAVEFNTRAGMNVYDFMFGDYRYKRQLCTHQAELHWLELQRPKFKFRVEESLRVWVRAWRAYIAKYAKPATPDAAA